MGGLPRDIKVIVILPQSRNAESDIDTNINLDAAYLDAYADY
jgi:hypothetical protein